MTPKESVCGERVRLRSFKVDDVEPYRRIVNDPEVIRLADRHDVVAFPQHLDWCMSMLEAKDVVFWAIADRDEKMSRLLGAVWLWGIQGGEAEVRIILGPPWGQGRGTEALRLVALDAFEKRKIFKLYAYVLAINPRARRAFESVGFKVETTLLGDRVSAGERVDVWRLIKR